MAGAIVLVVVIGGGSGYTLARVSADLRQARSDLEEVDALVEDGRLGDAQIRLDEAFTLAERANRRLYGNPALELLATLPVAGENIDALRKATGDSLQLIDSGRRVLDAGAPLADDAGQLEVPLRSGAVPVEAVADVRMELLAAADALPRGEPSQRWLAGPVRELTKEVAEESEARVEQFRNVGHALQVVEELGGADGPRRFLVTVANPGEMRGTGGMVLSYGILDSNGGEADVSAFGRIDELRLDGPLPADQVKLPEDYLQRWDGFDVTELWRNATMGADLPVVAPTMLQMFEEATGTSADGLIQVDPLGLAELLRATGPVTVPEVGVVDADNVVALTLNEAYFRFPDVDQRSDVLGDVAEAAFDRLLTGEYPSLRDLGEGLLDAVGGRHLAMYSTSSDVQAVLEDFGATASLPDRSEEQVHLGVQNISGNKLDYYLDTAVTLTGERLAGETGTVQATVAITNTAPAGVTAPRYVFGPFDEDQEVGVYRGIVTLYLPRGTSLEGESGGETINRPVVQAEGGRAVVSYTVAVPAQATSIVVLDLRLPPRADGDYTLTAVPAGRVRPTTLRVDIATGGAPLRATLLLDETYTLAPGREPEPTVPG